MSGQTLTDVVGSVVSSMFKVITIDDRIQEYIVCLDKYMTEKELPFSTAFEKSVCSCHATHLTVQMHRNMINSYLNTRRGNVPKTFDADDWTSLNWEITAFEQFLKEHQYSTVSQLIDLGFDQRIVKCTLGKEAVTENNITRCGELWEKSRMLAGRPDVSFHVYRRMRIIAEKLVQQCVRTRVSLTTAETEQAVAEALRLKILKTQESGKVG
jgi:hypothetical protein